MEDTISQILEADEYLIWKGKPEDFITLDKTNKKSFISRLIGAAVTAVVILVLYVLIINRKGADINYFIFFAVIGLSALSPLSIFTYAGKLRNKAVYAASNHRLIVYSGDLKTVSYDYIKEACFRTDEDGHTTLLCGKGAVDAKPSKWRLISLFGFNDLEAKDGPVCERFAFYALGKPEELREILAPYLKID